MGNDSFEKNLNIRYLSLISDIFHILAKHDEDNFKGHKAIVTSKIKLVGMALVYTEKEGEDVTNGATFFGENIVDRLEIFINEFREFKSDAKSKSA